MNREIGLLLFLISIISCGVDSAKEKSESLAIDILVDYSIDSLLSEFEMMETDREYNLNDTINDVYIPKDIEDCFNQIDIFWSDSLKAEVKKMSEEEFLGNAHFGIGLWIRNNWQLWGGSRLSAYFNELGVFHPDDISGLILSSYHKYLTGQEIELDEQIRSYKLYWIVQNEPRKEEFPDGAKNLNFDSKMLYNLKESNLPGCIHVLTDSIRNKIWVYDIYFGWKQITEIELQGLDVPEKREENLKKIFSTK